MIAGLPIDTLGGVDADVLAGLALLDRSPPLWAVDVLAWRLIVDTVRGFAMRFDPRARDVGWSTLDLYGLHRSAPYANLASMGAAFALAKGGHRAVAVDAKAVTVRTYTGATLRAYRPTAPIDAAVAWSLCTREGRRV
jgi:hypothetical protein